MKITKFHAHFTWACKKFYDIRALSFSLFFHYIGLLINLQVICLQEVQKTHYEDFFKPELQKLGECTRILKTIMYGKMRLLGSSIRIAHHTDRGPCI